MRLREQSIDGESGEPPLNYLLFQGIENFESFRPTVLAARRAPPGRFAARAFSARKCNFSRVSGLAFAFHTAFWFTASCAGEVVHDETG